MKSINEILILTPDNNKSLNQDGRIDGIYFEGNGFNV